MGRNMRNLKPGMAGHRFGRYRHREWIPRKNSRVIFEAFSTGGCAHNPAIGAPALGFFPIIRDSARLCGGLPACLKARRDNAALFNALLPTTFFAGTCSKPFKAQAEAFPCAKTGALISTREEVPT